MAQELTTTLGDQEQSALNIGVTASDNNVKKQITEKLERMVSPTVIIMDSSTHFSQVRG